MKKSTKKTKTENNSKQIDDLLKDNIKTSKDEIEQAQDELYEPNKPKRQKKLILTIVLSVIALLLVLFYFVNPFKITTTRFETRKDSKISFDNLVQIVPKGGGYELNLTVKDSSIDTSKIKWDVNTLAYITLAKCSETKCFITGDKIGSETIVTATYDDNNIAKISIDVIDNQFLYVYSYLDDDEYNTYFISPYNDNDNDSLEYRYTCSSYKCFGLSASKNFILISEDGYDYIINTKTNEKELLDSKVFKDNLSLVESDNKIIGLIIDRNKYYSMTDKKVLIDADEGYLFLNQSLIDSNRIIAVENEKTIINDLTTGKKIKEVNDKIGYFKTIKLGNKEYYLNSHYEDEYLYSIYSKDFDLLLKNISSYYIQNDNILVLQSDNNKEIKKYNSSLKLVSTSKSYDRVYSILDKYILVLEGTNVNILDINENLITHFLTLSNDMEYYSSYYFPEEGPKGPSFIVSTKNKKTQEKVYTEYFYDLQTKEITSHIIEDDEEGIS